MGPLADPLVLASRSPQRRAILEPLGVEFEVISSMVEEETRGEPRQEGVENALRKARAVAGEPPARRLLERGRPAGGRAPAAGPVSCPLGWCFPPCGVKGVADAPRIRGGPRAGPRHVPEPVRRGAAEPAG